MALEVGWGGRPLLRVESSLQGVLGTPVRVQKEGTGLAG